MGISLTYYQRGPPYCCTIIKGDAAMTVRYPRATLGDKILKLLGKERSILIPEDINDVHEKYGPYVDFLVKRENFWKALCRKKGDTLSR